MEIKGTQLRYDLIFIDGHENNNGTLGYEQWVEQRYSFLYVS